MLLLLMMVILMVLIVSLLVVLLRRIVRLSRRGVRNLLATEVNVWNIRAHTDDTRINEATWLGLALLRCPSRRVLLSVVSIGVLILVLLSAAVLVVLLLRMAGLLLLVMLLSVLILLLLLVLMTLVLLMLLLGLRLLRGMNVLLLRRLAICGCIVHNPSIPLLLLSLALPSLLGLLCFWIVYC